MPPCRRATSSGRDATASAPARRPSHGRFELAHGYNLFLPRMNDFFLPQMDDFFLPQIAQIYTDFVVVRQQACKTLFRLSHYLCLSVLSVEDFSDIL